MDYEKKYKEALGWMQSLYNGLHGPTKEDAEHFFPELKEIIDEQVRKALLEMVHDTTGDELWTNYNVHKEEALAWLEKQGEQNPTDIKTWKYIVDAVLTAKGGIGQYLDDPWTTGVAERLQERFGNILQQKSFEPKQKPKFQIGDWVIFDNNHNSLYQIECIENYQYFLRHYLGGSMALGFCNEDDLRLWTFKDATEGDILINVENKFPFIYKGRLDPKHLDSPVAYCGIDASGRFHISQPGTNFWWTNAEVQPAAKRQRDTLIKMMTEEGYVFDFNKKELKKMDQLTQKKEVKDIAKNITTELLEKNGFEFSHERCEGFECYYRGFDSKVDVDLIHYENPDTDWELTIMFKDSKEELVKVISTVEELQQCIDVMNLNLKIKV